VKTQLQFVSKQTSKCVNNNNNNNNNNNKIMAVPVCSYANNVEDVEWVFTKFYTGGYCG
jgi:hypothetical protein